MSDAAGEDRWLGSNLLEWCSLVAALDRAVAGAFFLGSTAGLVAGSRSLPALRSVDAPLMVVAGASLVLLSLVALAAGLPRYRRLRLTLAGSPELHRAPESRTEYCRAAGGFHARPRQESAL